MTDNLFKYSTWFAGAFFVFVLFYAAYSTGAHTARESLCSRVDGVYVQTYTKGWQCIQATVIEMK